MFLRPEPTPSPRWSAELPPAALALAVASAVVLRWLPTAASYDEGVYLNSLRSLISGHPLGREVFASQPPGLYDLLRLDWSFFPHSLTGLRTRFAGL